MNTSAFIVSIIKKKNSLGNLQTCVIPSDRRNRAVFKPGSQKVAILIVMKACLTRSLPSFAGSCSICLEWVQVLYGRQYCNLANNGKHLKKKAREVWGRPHDHESFSSKEIVLATTLTSYGNHFLGNHSSSSLLCHPLSYLYLCKAVLRC